MRDRAAALEKAVVAFRGLLHQGLGQLRLSIRAEGRAEDAAATCESRSELRGDTVVVADVLRQYVEAEALARRISVRHPGPVLPHAAAVSAANPVEAEARSAGADVHRGPAAARVERCPAAGERAAAFTVEAPETAGRTEATAAVG